MAEAQRQKKRMRSELMAEAVMKRPKTTAEEIPDDVLVHILLRLSTKSVARFRCLSKQWNSLISDPWFINLHQQNSKQNLELFYVTSGANYDRSFQFTSTDIKGKILEKFTFRVGIQGFRGVRFVGSAGGLICFETREYPQVYIFDPATRKLLLLPRQSPSTREFRPAGCALGFGYVASTGEHKILRSVVGRDELHREILSFHAGSRSCSSWRAINKKMTWNLKSESAVSANGCLHWLYKTSCRSKLILSFDLGREKFGFLPSPPIGKWHCDQLQLVDLEGNLSLVSIFGPILTIWKLQDYEKLSWIKAYDIDLYPVNPRMSRLRAILRTKDGHLLIIPQCSSEIYLYSKELRAVEVPKQKGELCFESMRWL